MLLIYDNIGDLAHYHQIIRTKYLGLLLKANKSVVFIAITSRLGAMHWSFDDLFSHRQYVGLPDRAMRAETIRRLLQSYDGGYDVSEIEVIELSGELTEGLTIQDLESCFARLKEDLEEDMLGTKWQRVCISHQ